LTYRPPGIKLLFLKRYAEAYIAEMKAFSDSILQDIAPPAPGLEGRIPVVMEWRPGDHTLKTGR
jgi:hypothetical protein